MNKTELINQIAEKADLTKKDSEKALNAFIGTVTEERSTLRVSGAATLLRGMFMI